MSAMQECKLLIAPRNKNKSIVSLPVIILQQEQVHQCQGKSRSYVGIIRFVVNVFVLQR